LPVEDVVEHVATIDLLTELFAHTFTVFQSADPINAFLLSVMPTTTTLRVLVTCHRTLVDVLLSRTNPLLYWIQYRYISFIRPHYPERQMIFWPACRRPSAGPNSSPPMEQLSSLVFRPIPDSLICTPILLPSSNYNRRSTMLYRDAFNVTAEGRLTTLKFHVCCQTIACVLKGAPEDMISLSMSSITIRDRSVGGARSS
jgi:hypothetical protein